MRPVLPLFALLPLCLWGGCPALAADCSDTAVDQADMTICADTHFKEADAALNASYAQLMKDLDPDTAAKLRAAQRLWLPYRDAACEAEAFLFDGGSMQPMVQLDCMTRLTKARVEDLTAFAPQG